MSHVAKYEFAIEHVNIDILKAAAANVAEMLGVQVTDTVSRWQDFCWQARRPRRWFLG